MIVDTIPCKGCGDYPGVEIDRDQKVLLMCGNAKTGRCKSDYKTRRHTYVLSLVREWNNNN